MQQSQRMEHPENSPGIDKEPEERSKGCKEGRTLSDGGPAQRQRGGEAGPEEVAGWLYLFQNNWLCIFGVTSFFVSKLSKSLLSYLTVENITSKVWLLSRCYPARHKFPLLLEYLPPSPVLHNNLDHLHGTYLCVNRWCQISLGQLSILPPNWTVTSANNEQQWTHFCMHLC